MSVLKNHNVLLGVCGGIAAYKSAILVRRLVDCGANVRVVMTASAQQFISGLTFQALTGNAVHTDLLDEQAEAAMGHIELARWADSILIAPATANTIANIAHGFSQDLLSTLCLASEAPLYIAPAMNRLMWSHPATRENCQRLRSRGVQLFGPAEGIQACGETGAGRLLEPETIRDKLQTALQARLSNADLTQRLKGKRLLITAGPTREPIDPVRFISNRSSGKMGFAIAEAAVAMGAEVTLVTGPVNLEAIDPIKRINVNTAEQMLDQVMKEVEHCDIFIGVAAVSDYRIANVADQKLKKTAGQLQLSLVKNPDILQQVAQLENRPFCVGFAAETQQVEKHARQKLSAKRLDLIAANQVATAHNPVFGSDYNALTVFKAGNEPGVNIQEGSKIQVASQLLGIIADELK